MNKLPIIGVMGSGKEAWQEWAHPLGLALAKLPCHLLTGGGKGTMEVVSKAYVSVEGRVGKCLAIVPCEHHPDGRISTKAGYPNDFAEISILTPLGVFEGDANVFTRNHVNVLSSALIIALPGAKGTKNEVELAVKFKKPVLLFGPEREFVEFPGELPRVSDLDELMERVATYLA